MKIKNLPKRADANLDNIFAFAGFTLVIVAFVATIFSALTNLRSITGPAEAIYYFRYFILFGGSLLICYLLTRNKPNATRSGRLLMGTTYAMLALLIFGLIQIIRFALFRGPLFSLSQAQWPLDSLFASALLPLLITACVAYISLRHVTHASLTAPTKIALIGTFIAYQLYTILEQYRYLFSNISLHDPDTYKWFVIIGFIMTPVIVAVIGYLLIRQQAQIDRLFYAAFVGVFYTILNGVLMEFHLDASRTIRMAFGIVAIILSLLCTGLLIWQAHKATAQSITGTKT